MNLINEWPYIYCVAIHILGVALHIFVWPYICTTGQILTTFNLYFEVKHFVDGKIPTLFCR